MRTHDNSVEVDMVPMIDIISLLLMFLIIVGDTAASASSVQMQLPRGMDQALSDKDGRLRTEGRIVIELMLAPDGKYRAVMNGRSYELIAGPGNGTLIGHLQQQISTSVTLGH